MIIPSAADCGHRGGIGEASGHCTDTLIEWLNLQAKDFTKVL